jgi:hypothetical protein
MPAPKDPIKNIEWRDKIRKYNLKNGIIPPSRKGISPSIKTREKQSESMKNGGYLPPSAKGKKRTQEFKDKVSKNHSHYWLGKTGKQTPNYKDGRTPENKKIRSSVEIKLWRKSCMERDDFTCQKTGQKGGDLTVHHINNFADFPELRTSIENGITLSKKSHEEFHKEYGRKNNTKEQLEEFINN